MPRFTLSDFCFVSIHDIGIMKTIITYLPAIIALGIFTTAPAEEAVTLEITGNDLMQFSTKELKVKSGQEVTLKLKHTGMLPKAAMGHNVVILQAGVAMAAFATKSMTAAATDYLPEDEESKNQILVATKMLGGGEETEIKFTAPAAGEYAFLCTFPGHFAIMNGKLIVE